MIRRTKIWSAFALALALNCTGYLSAEETKGTVKSVDTGRNEVVLKGTIRNSTYELSKDAAVCLDGVKGKLSDLQEGDHAVIIYQKQGEHMIATEVRGLRNAKETNGTVRGIFADKKEITLKGIIKDSTYELDKNATVWVNGNRSALTNIREGDEVVITYQEKGDHYMAARVCATRK